MILFKSVKTSKIRVQWLVFLKNWSYLYKVNLEGWWHARRHVRKADGEQNE